MRNEILKPVLDTDEVAVPRYDVVGPDGAVLQQNVELRLKNEVMQQGTPYDADAVLPDDLSESLDLDPKTSTPAQALRKVVTDVKTVAEGVPQVGDTLTTARTNLGDDWLLCNGTIVDADTYPELFKTLALYAQAWPTGSQRVFGRMPDVCIPYSCAYGDGMFFVPMYNGSVYVVNVIDAVTGSVIRQAGSDLNLTSYPACCGYHDGVLVLAYRTGLNTTLYYALSRDGGATFTTYTVTTANGVTYGTIVWSPNDNAFIVMPNYGIQSNTYDVTLIYPETNTAATGTITGMGYASNYGTISISLNVLPDGTIVMLESSGQVSSSLYSSKARLTYRTRGIGEYTYTETLPSVSSASTSDYYFTRCMDWDEKTQTLYLFTSGTSGTEVYTLANDGTKTLKATLTHSYAVVNSATSFVRVNVLRSFRVFDNIIVKKFYRDNYSYLFDLETGEYIGTAQTATGTTVTIYGFVNAPAMYIDGRYVYITQAYSNNDYYCAICALGKLLPTISLDNAYGYIKGR